MRMLWREDAPAWRKSLGKDEGNCQVVFDNEGQSWIPRFKYLVAASGFHFPRVILTEDELQFCS